MDAKISFRSHIKGIVYLIQFNFTLKLWKLQEKNCSSHFSNTFFVGCIIQKASSALLVTFSNKLNWNFMKIPVNDERIGLDLYKRNSIKTFWIVLQYGEIYVVYNTKHHLIFLPFINIFSFAWK